jgi:electron transport complex protein RnfG
MLKLGTILLSVCLLAAGVLSLVNSQTKPVIEANNAAKQSLALIEVLPQAKAGVIVPVMKDGVITHYRGYADAETTRLVGYAVAVGGVGYSSVVRSIVGVGLDGKIENVKIMEPITETPGLGDKVLAEGSYGGKRQRWFMQLVGRQAPELVVNKDGGPIDAVTGATISSRAVVNSLRRGLTQLGTDENLGQAAASTATYDTTGATPAAEGTEK